MGDRSNQGPRKGQGEQQEGQRERKAPIMDFTQFLDKRVRIKFTGGREVSGTLKGADQLMNFVIDDAVEYLRDPKDSSVVTDQTRNLGLVITRGTALALICPEVGMEELAHNPYEQQS